MKYLATIILAIVLNLNDESVYCSDAHGNKIYKSGSRYYTKHVIQRYNGDEKEIKIYMSEGQANARCF